MNWTKIIKSTEEESNNTIEMMEKFEEEENKPQIGIFWYKDKKLYLPVTCDYDMGCDINKAGDTTHKKLHKTVWKKEYYRGNTDGIKDYKQVCRGRVFYNTNTDRFKVKIGSWFNELSESEKNDLKNQIEIEFNLIGKSVDFIQDEHWDIGNGFEL